MASKQIWGSPVISAESGRYKPIESSKTKLHVVPVKVFRKGKYELLVMRGSAHYYIIIQGRIDTLISHLELMNGSFECSCWPKYLKRLLWKARDFVLSLMEEDEK